MKRIVPGKTNQKLPVILKLTFPDIIYIIVSLAIVITTVILMTLCKVEPWFVILLLVLIEIALEIILFARVTEYRLYHYVGHIFMFLFRHKEFAKTTLGQQLGISFKENAVINETGTYSKILNIQGSDFSLINEDAQDIKISQLANVLSGIDLGKIVKLDTPLRFSKNADEAANRIKEFTKRYESIEDKNSLEAVQIESRIAALDVDLKIFEALENNRNILVNDYYIIIYNDNMNNLNNEIDRAIRLLNSMGLYAFELNKKEVLEFYSNYFDASVNADKKLEFNEMKEHAKYFEFGNKKYCVQTISELPYTFDNAWLAPLSNIPGVKLVVNFKNNPDMAKALKRINKRIVNLGEMLLGKNTESEKIELSIQIQAYQELLEELKFNKEQLHITEIMFIYEYDKKTMKDITSTIKTFMKCRVDSLAFRQTEVFINTFPHIPSKNIKYLQRDFPSSSFAGSFPFISDLFIDYDGDYIGNNSGPVFFDMWENINNPGGTRTNANIMTIGASGKGKSYLQKILIKNQLLRDSKVFILDPENEYSYLANKFGGDVIDVSGGDIRINPFEVFPELDDEGKPTRTFGMLNKHLAFLSDFFKVTLPDLSPFTRQVLNNMMNDLYATKGIYSAGYRKDPKSEEFESFEKLKSKDYPTFDDLIKFVKDIKIDKLTNQEQEAYIELKAFLQDFEKSGRFGSIWNGKTTINLKNDFVVFNFRGLDNGSGSEIKNGQMLLITKYLMKEIINNYQLNLKRSKEELKHVILLVDEAHNFIDPNFPVALDMMKNMAKRIRKYTGSLWVATQNIADFIGFDVNTRTKATSVLNNCQYTFLFGLKPDDIDSVKEMYSKSGVGALTEEEINYLSAAGQGDALLLVDASTRISFHVSLKDREAEENFILIK